MSEATQILQSIERGDRQAAERLLPLVYSELRKLASDWLEREKSGQTLQATALVHEAYLRLLGSQAEGPSWEGRRHFFAAAAESMRRILVESARRKKRLKHGGDREREFADGSLGELPDVVADVREDLVALDDALAKLALHDAAAAELIQLRYFAGLTGAEAAEMLGISPRSVDRLWSYAKAWLHREMQHENSSS